MTSYILQENVLSDDILHVADENKVFKGGYIAIVKYNEFLNAWSDRTNTKHFKSQKSLDKFLNKNYPEFIY